MAFDRYTDDGFDLCEPPICEEDFGIEITQEECNAGVINISWQIIDRYNRNLQPLSNRVEWAHDDPVNLVNISNANNSTQPYHTYFNAPSDEGLVYFKVKASIRGVFIESNLRWIDCATCYPDDSPYMLRAKICNSCDGGPVTEPYALWVKENGVPGIPTYFSYDSNCWYLDQDSEDNKVIIDPNQGTLIDSTAEDDDTIYSSCEACCLDLDCPSEWVYSAQHGEEVANFYIEYDTYTLRDQIRVVGPYIGSCITAPVIWDSGIVGTCRTKTTGSYPMDCTSRPCEDGGEGRGIYVSNPKFLDSTCVKALCFLVRKSQMPLAVQISPGEPGTYWCVYIEGPEDYQYDKCNHSTEVCDPISGSSSSSLLSSSSSSSQYSSSSSSLFSSSSSSQSSSSSYFSSSSSSQSSSSSSSSSSQSSSSSSSSSSSGSSSSSSSSSSESSSSSQSSSSSRFSSSSSSRSSSSCSSSSSSQFVHSSSAGPVGGFLLHEYSEEEINTLHGKYAHLLAGKTTDEKENILIDLVSNGELTADQALALALREGLILDT